MYIFLLLTSAAYSQKKPLDLAIIGETLKGFTLPVYQGGEFNLAAEKGKNLLLVFPRGYYDKDVWCDICAYEYLDLIDEFYTKKLADQYNLDLVFILPYDATTITKWLEDMPEVYASLEAGKHQDTIANAKAATWVQFANKHYPKTFTLNKEETPVPYRILVDKDRVLSERLEIFKTEWWGTTVGQNLPTLILLDENATVLFKYISQHTIDRPGSEYLKLLMSTLLAVK